MTPNRSTAYGAGAVDRTAKTLPETVSDRKGKVEEEPSAKPAGNPPTCPASCTTAMSPESARFGDSWTRHGLRFFLLKSCDGRGKIPIIGHRLRTA